MESRDREVSSSNSDLWSAALFFITSHFSNRTIKARFVIIGPFFNTALFCNDLSPFWISFIRIRSTLSKTSEFEFLTDPYLSISAQSDFLRFLYHWIISLNQLLKSSWISAKMSHSDSYKFDSYKKKSIYLLHRAQTFSTGF